MNRLRLILGAVLVLGCAALATRLKISNDATEHFPRTNRAVAEWIDLSTRFDAFNTMIVGLEEPGPAFTADGLQRLQKITSRLGSMKASGVLAAQSLTNVESIHEGADGSLETELLIPKIPADTATLSRKVASDAQVSGALISRDQKAYLIIIRADPRKDASALATEIFKVVDEERGPMRAAWFGAALLQAAFAREVTSKLPWVIPLCAAVLLVVSGLSLRRPRKIAAHLGATLAVGVVWAGLAQLTGASIGVSALAAVPAVLLLAAASFGRAPPVGTQAVARIAVLGLIGFLLSRDQVAFVAGFGFALALGAVAIAMVGLLIFAPLASWAPETTPSQPTSMVGLLAVLALAVAGGFGIARERFAATPATIFKPSEAAGQSLAFFDDHFGGADFVQVNFRGNLKDPGVAARLLRLTDLLEGSPRFGDVRSVSQVLGFLNHGFGGVNRIPASKETLANLWFFLEGRSDVRSLVSDARDEAVIAIRVSPGRTEDELAGDLALATTASLKQDVEGASARIGALAAAFKVTLEPAKVEAAFTAPDTDVTGEVNERLRAWLASPDSPFQPTDAEWQVLAPVVRDREALAKAAATLPSVADHAAQLAESIRARESDLRIAALAEHRVATLLGAAEVPAAFRQRVAGVFAELLQPQEDPGAASQVVVSGLPMIAPQLERELSRGLNRALLILFVACGLVAWLLTRSGAFALRTVLEAVAASGLTIAAVTSFAGGVDPGSGPLMLVPPLLVLVLFDLANPRAAAGVLLALGLAAAPLLLIGSGPLTRIGVVVLIAAFDVVAVRTVSQAFVKRSG